MGSGVGGGREGWRAGGEGRETEGGGLGKEGCNPPKRI